MTEPIALVTEKSDAALAEDYKKRVSEHLLAICAIMDEAEKAGLTIGFQMGQMASYGAKKNIIAALVVSRSY